MGDNNYLVCPEGHSVSYESWNYARDFSSGERDVMTGQPVFEGGLYCQLCDRAYGLTRLREPVSLLESELND